MERDSTYSGTQVDHRYSIEARIDRQIVRTRESPLSPGHRSNHETNAVQAIEVRVIREQVHARLQFVTNHSVTSCVAGWLALVSQFQACAGYRL
jgi:hypothetical protein